MLESAALGVGRQVAKTLGHAVQAKLAQTVQCWVIQQGGSPQWKYRDPRMLSGSRGVPSAACGDACWSSRCLRIEATLSYDSAPTSMARMLTASARAAAMPR